MAICDERYLFQVMFWVKKQINNVIVGKVIFRLSEVTLLGFLF